jgi:hypothetical protein
VEIGAQSCLAAGRKLKPLACHRGFKSGEAGDVPARLVEPRDDAAGELATGSLVPAKTIGIVRVSRWTATVGGVVNVMMMSGCRPTNSCASARIR